MKKMETFFLMQTSIIIQIFNDMKMSKFFTTIFMTLLCLNFISCSDDDKEENNTIVVNPNAPQKRVKQITETANDLSDCYIYDIEYNINNRVSKITTTHTGYGRKELCETIEFEYSENNVSMRFKEKYLNRETQESYPLNSDGFIDKMGKHPVFYSNGYLKDVPDANYDYDENNNLIYVREIESYSFTYTEIPNIGNLDIPKIISKRGSIPGSTELYMRCMTDLLGKTSPYLPKEYKRYSLSTENILIQYESDKDGYITRIPSIIEFRIYEFTYEEVK